MREWWFKVGEEKGERHENVSVLPNFCPLVPLEKRKIVAAPTELVQRIDGSGSSGEPPAFEDAIANAVEGQLFSSSFSSSLFEGLACLACFLLVGWLLNLFLRGHGLRGEPQS